MYALGREMFFTVVCVDVLRQLHESIIAAYFLFDLSLTGGLIERAIWWSLPCTLGRCKLCSTSNAFCHHGAGSTSHIISAGSNASPNPGNDSLQSRIMPRSRKRTTFKHVAKRAYTTRVRVVGVRVRLFDNTTCCHFPAAVT